MPLEIVAVAIGGFFLYGIGTLGEVAKNKNERNSNSDKKNKTTSGGFYEKIDIEAEIEHFRKNGFQYVFYARKMRKSNGALIQCVRFYRDVMWFEYDILTGDLLRSFYPYQEEIKKIKKQNRYERNARIKRRFGGSPETIVVAKSKLGATI